MTKLKCLVCGNIWLDNSKDSSLISCPKCKGKKIGTPPKENTQKIVLDSITSSIARTVAFIYYYILLGIQNFLFKYEYDMRNFVILALLLGIIAFLKLTIFIGEPLYVLGAIVVTAMFIIKIRF